MCSSVAVGVVAGLARKQAQMEAKSAQFGVYADRFIEHAATYRGQDEAGAAGYQQAQWRESEGPHAVDDDEPYVVDDPRVLAALTGPSNDLILGGGWTWADKGLGGT